MTGHLWGLCLRDQVSLPWPEQGGATRMMEQVSSSRMAAEPAEHMSTLKKKT